MRSLLLHLDGREGGLASSFATTESILPSCITGNGTLCRSWELAPTNTCSRGFALLMLLGGFQGQPMELRMLPLHRGGDWGVDKQAVLKEDSDTAGMHSHLSGACLVQAGVPARCNSGQTCSTRAACPARLGDPRASISPRLQKGLGNTCHLGQQGKSDTFPKWGKGRWEDLKPRSVQGLAYLFLSWRRISINSLGMRQRQLPSMGRRQTDRHLDTHSLPYTTQISVCFFLSIFRVILSSCSHPVLVLHTYHARPAAVKDQDEITWFF